MPTAVSKSSPNMASLLAGIDLAAKYAASAFSCTAAACSLVSLQEHGTGWAGAPT